MDTTLSHGRARRGPAVRRPAADTLLLGVLALGLTGCGDILSVDNPNNVIQEDVERPAAAAAVVNGALAQTAHAASVLVRLQTGLLSDELVWIGSQTQIQAIHQGQHGVVDNQWTTEGYEQLSVARWLSDEAIRLLRTFEEDGINLDPVLLGRAYLYSGFNYMTFPDVFEDVAFSDRMEPGPPVGEANMHTVYDLGIERLDQAIAIFQQAGATDLAVTALALRARARWAKALWGKLNPPGQVPSDPLIDDAGANADAQAVLDQVSPGWRFLFTFSGASQPNEAALDVERQGNVGLNWKYFRLGQDGRLTCGPWHDACPVAVIEVHDPIDDIESPPLRDFLFEFVGEGQFAPLPAVTAKEMHLILAEAALKRGDTGAFTMHVNAIRSVYPQLSPYDPAVHTNVDPLALLKYERVANLFLQVARRIGDEYRFGEPSEFWIPTSLAATTPGALFPVPSSERESNCYYLGTC